MSTASKGRTHGCNDQCCKTVKKALAKPEPSTHGTSRTWRDGCYESVMRMKADIGSPSDQFRFMTIWSSLRRSVTDAHSKPHAPRYAVEGQRSLIHFDWLSA